MISNAPYVTLVGWPDISKFTEQHSLTLDLRMSNGERSLKLIECLKLVNTFILHIREIVCCFDLDACVVEKRPYFVAHNENVVLPQDNAPCHDTRNTRK